MTVQEATTTELQEKIKSGNLIMVDFFAEWCGPCKQISPILDELEKDANGQYEIYKNGRRQRRSPRFHYGANGDVHSYRGFLQRWQASGCLRRPPRQRDHQRHDSKAH